jgi:hypothetical protein
MEILVIVAVGIALFYFRKEITAWFKKDEPPAPPAPPVV